MLMKSVLAALMITFGTAVAHANPLSATVTTPPQAAGFNMGESHRPDGMVLTLDSNSLRLNGKPWMPVMGEFHYARYPENEWREELLKMKTGGVNTVATYVFWIYHEEIEGQFDWSGRRDLRHFIQLCGEVGLKVIVRCGPWDHGEVRNGGLPDWLLKKGWEMRSNDTNYLATTKILYGEISKQLSGLLWKDGGPVIGIQLENEYNGPAEHLLALKRLAREAGLDVPLYTRTGWPALSTPHAVWRNCSALRSLCGRLLGSRTDAHAGQLLARISFCLPAHRRGNRHGHPRPARGQRRSRRWQSIPISPAKLARA